MSRSPDRATITRMTEAPALRGRLAEDVRDGLSGAQKHLPSKYFYDARGSELFERITELPEYYLTRKETSILERDADAIMDALRPGELVEIGSGSSRKTRILLEAMHRAGGGDRYVPLDVSDAALRAAADALVESYPWLTVRAIRGDLKTDLASIPRHGRRLVIFLGSTIGNLHPEERLTFYRRVRTMLTADDRLMVGYDLVKKKELLERAYNDSSGVTAEFNRNILAVVNRELGAAFPIEEFRHVSRYDDAEDRIVSGLAASRAMTVPVPGAGIEVHLDEGEVIRTEISAKFTREIVVGEMEACGLALESWRTDDDGWFALAVSTRSDERMEDGR